MQPFFTAWFPRFFASMGTVVERGLMFLFKDEHTHTSKPITSCAAGARSDAESPDAPSRLLHDITVGENIGRRQRSRKIKYNVSWRIGPVQFLSACGFSCEISALCNFGIKHANAKTVNSFSQAKLYCRLNAQST
jgi:hypothetical protein